MQQPQRRKSRVVRAADSIPVDVLLNVARCCPHLRLSSRGCGVGSSVYQVRHIVVVRVLLPVLTAVKGGEGGVPSTNSHLPSLPTKRAVGASQPLDSSSTAVWMTPRSGVEQHAMLALITRALSVKLSSVLRTAEYHSRRTLVSCGNVHRSMCHCSRPTSALLNHLGCSPQAQMTLSLSAPAQSSSRAPVGKLPCIIFVIDGDARFDLARPIAPREKVARSGPSFSRKREIDSPVRAG